MTLELRTIASACIPHPHGLWGPKWGSTCPPGLPESARHAAAADDTLAGDWAAYFDAPLGLRKTLVELSWGESRHIQGLPARNFEGRLVEGYDADRAERLRYVADPHGPRRPVDSDLVTAWGAYSFNRQHLRLALAELGATVAVAAPLPWEVSPVEEFAIPTRLYIKVWHDMDGMSLGDAQRGAMVRLRHAEPATYKAVMHALTLGDSFSIAWAHCVNAGKRRTIASHIDRAGLGVV